jgi:hypothetical protein
MTELFDVWLFYRSGWHERLEEDLSAEQAVAAAKRFSESVGAKTGLLEEIRITDSGDNCVFQWIHGKGVTFPPRDGPPVDEGPP